MSLHRRAAKRDAAEPAIVSALEALGCVVWRVSGKGLPDLIVLRAGKKWLADVKGPKEKPTPAQEKAWEEAATKARCSVFILRTPEDAAAMLSNALQPWEPRPNIYDPRHPYQKDMKRRRAQVETGYSPPRSTPVDAAKEAEATFAPPTLLCVRHDTDCGCEPCQRPGCIHKGPCPEDAPPQEYDPPCVADGCEGCSQCS